MLVDSLMFLKMKEKSGILSFLFDLMNVPCFYLIRVMAVHDSFRIFLFIWYILTFPVLKELIICIIQAKFALLTFNVLIGTVRLLNSDKMFITNIILSQLFIESICFFLQKIFCAFILSCVFTAFSLVLLPVLLFADS